MRQVCLAALALLSLSGVGWGGGAAIVIPPRGHDNITLGDPAGPSFGFRGDSDTTIVVTPHGNATDFDTGHGNHITVQPDGNTTFTFGDD